MTADALMTLAVAPAAGVLACAAAAKLNPLREAIPDRWRLGVVAAAVAVAAIAASAIDAGPQRITATALGWFLLILAVMDLRSHRLADVLTLPLAPAGLLHAIALDAPILAHMAGAALGAAVLMGPLLVFRAVRGADGLGLGDVKLMAAAGAWTGAAAVPGILLIACASTIAAALLLGRRGLATAVPFGPGIASGFWIAFVCGPLHLG